ncbi:MAG: NAD-dependent epimerase/dehydratase family protein [Gemmatimonadota bacterium]|nr:MAG: NAD-dependent epimerase/dehydratase family protein [Gemmatimonadota bacterium]
MKRILITGVHGQIGSELIEELQNRYGMENVVGVDIKERPSPTSGICEIVDVSHKTGIQNIIEKYNIDTVFHLASLLSVKGEKKPDLAWDVNMNGLKNILDLARDYTMKVFWPSSIAVFGPNSPKKNTPQSTVLDPNTMYGITKVAGELLCNYYFEKFAVDVRSVRYPGIISYKTEPGGGTTDYAVEIFLEAVKKKEYTCFVGPETRLPMMYMTDAIKAALDIMQAEVSQVKIRTSYNLTAVSFSVAELVIEIKKYIPEFTCHYAPDFRQNIANSWPQVIDDSEARQDWNWEHRYDLSSIVKDMLVKLSERLNYV